MKRIIIAATALMLALAFGGVGAAGTTANANLEWQGDYTAESSAYVITISDFDGTGFNFEAHRLSQPPRLVAGGYAKLNPDNALMAEYNQLSFKMHEDHWTLDVSTPEDHDLSGLSGKYSKNDYSPLSGLYSDEGGHILLAIRSYNATKGAIQFAIIPFVEGYDPEYGVAMENPDKPGQAEGSGYTFQLIANDPLLESDDTILVSGNDLEESFTRSDSSDYDWKSWRAPGQNK